MNSITISLNNCILMFEKMEFWHIFHLVFLLSKLQLSLSFRLLLALLIWVKPFYWSCSSRNGYIIFSSILDIPSLTEILQSNLYIWPLLGPLKYSCYRQVVVVQKHSKQQPLNKVVIMYRYSEKSACQIWREYYLGLNQPFTKFVEAANNLTKLAEVGKHITKFVELANILTNFVEFANNFVKFVEFPNNFYEVHRSCEQL